MIRRKKSHPVTEYYQCMAMKYVSISTVILVMFNPSRPLAYFLDKNLVSALKMTINRPQRNQKFQRYRCGSPSPWSRAVKLWPRYKNRLSNKQDSLWHKPQIADVFRSVFKFAFFDCLWLSRCRETRLGDKAARAKNVAIIIPYIEKQEPHKHWGWGKKHSPRNPMAWVWHNRSVFLQCVKS